VKTRDDRLILGKPRVSLTKRSCEGVSDSLSRQILNQRSRLDPSASARVDPRRALTGGLGGVETLTRGATSQQYAEGAGRAGHWIADRRL
jgi:hypothetical protein